MGKFNENSKLKEILADNRALVIIEKYLPGILDNSGVKMAKFLNPSVKQAMRYREHVNMSEETMQKFLGELFALD
ncbi:MAG: hypothetical protein ACOX3U_05670 [Christensenellales bacterium]